MGNLLDREVGVVAENDGDAVVGAEAAERTLQLVALRDGATGVIRGRRRSRSIQAVVAPVSGPTEMIPTRVDQDAAEPRVEPIRITKPPVLSPGANERVVGRIFSLLCVAQDEEGKPIRSVEIRAAQALEGGITTRLDVGGREDTRLVAQTVLRRGMVPLPLPY